MGKGVAAQLVEDWDLDLDALQDNWDNMERGGRRHPKLVHNIILSMPSKTPPARLLAASRDVAREEFALKHRYAMVLHTDQAHPHVHLVVRAHDSDDRRLNINKAHLRRWREQFARHLRSHGLEANATPAQLRGKLSDHQKDGIYRTAQRGESRVEWEREGRALEAARAGEAHLINPSNCWSFPVADSVRIFPYCNLRCKGLADMGNHHHQCFRRGACSSRRLES